MYINTVWAEIALMGSNKPKERGWNLGGPAVGWSYLLVDAGSELKACQVVMAESISFAITFFFKQMLRRLSHPRDLFSGCA
jgi:hypothetical protein